MDELAPLKRTTPVRHNEQQAKEYFESSINLIKSMQKLHATYETSNVRYAFFLDGLLKSTVKLNDGREQSLIEYWGYTSPTNFFQETMGDASYPMQLKDIPKYLGQHPMADLIATGVTKCLIIAQAEKKRQQIGASETVKLDDGQKVTFTEALLTEARPHTDSAGKPVDVSVSALKNRVGELIGQRIGESIEHKTYTGRASTFQTQKKLLPVIQFVFGLDHTPSEGEALDIMQNWFLALGGLTDEKLTTLVYGELSPEEQVKSRLKLRVGLLIKLFRAMTIDEQEEVIPHVWDIYKKAETANSNESSFI